MLRLILLATLCLAAFANSSVVTLTTANFEKVVESKDAGFVLVEFYAPCKFAELVINALSFQITSASGCGHCKELTPKYSAAAKKLVGKATLAKA